MTGQKSLPLREPSIADLVEVLGASYDSVKDMPVLGLVSINIDLSIHTDVVEASFKTSSEFHARVVLTGHGIAIDRIESDGFDDLLTVYVRCKLS